MKLLVVFDLDLTLWDCEDISSTVPPYLRISKDIIADSNGRLIMLREGVRELLTWLKGLGATLAVVSWNVKWKALEALKGLGVKDYFDYIIVEPHPRKDIMFMKLLSAVGKVDRAYFIDDNRTMVELVKRAYPWVRALTYLNEVRTMREIKEVLRRELKVKEGL